MGDEERGEDEGAVLLLASVVQEGPDIGAEDLAGVRVFLDQVVECVAWVGGRQVQEDEGAIHGGEGDVTLLFRFYQEGM